jgi:hypothetical protein
VGSDAGSDDEYAAQLAKNAYLESVSGILDRNNSSLSPSRPFSRDSEAGNGNRSRQGSPLPLLNVTSLADHDRQSTNHEPDVLLLSEDNNVHDILSQDTGRESLVSITDSVDSLLTPHGPGDPWRSDYAYGIVHRNISLQDISS